MSRLLGLAGRADRGRRRPRPRQDEHAGVRRRRQHVQRGLRHHPQPVGHGAHLRRLVRRVSGGPGHGHGLARRRLRSRRLAADPGRVLRRRGPAALARPRAGRAFGAAVRHACGRGPDGPRRTRRRAVPRRAGGLRPARPAELRRLPTAYAATVERPVRLGRVAFTRTSAASRRSTRRSPRSAGRPRLASRRSVPRSRKPRPISARHRRVHGPARGAVCGEHGAAARAASRPPQARGRVEHRARAEPHRRRDRPRRARARPAAAAHGRVHGPLRPAPVPGRDRAAVPGRDTATSRS